MYSGVEGVMGECISLCRIFGSFLWCFERLFVDRSETRLGVESETLPPVSVRSCSPR